MKKRKQLSIDGKSQLDCVRHKHFVVFVSNRTDSGEHFRFIRGRFGVFEEADEQEAESGRRCRKF